MKKLVRFCHKFLLEFVLFLLLIYKKCISPFLPSACRFEPTCSVYMVEAIKKHGIIKGLYLGIKRVLRCNPWGGCGYDPVPDNNKNTNKNL